MDGLRDRDAVLERLAELYDQSDRPDEGRKVRAELEALRASARPDKWAWTSSAPPRTPEVSPPQAVKKKIGRNAPCPCGSGKKYKKCCGDRK